MNVVIADSYKNSSQTVLQNLRDQLVSAMTTTVLNGIVDSVTLINVAQSVAGIARARILFLIKLAQMVKYLNYKLKQMSIFHHTIY